MPVRRGTLSALPTLDSCPHLELLAKLLTRALLTTAPEACLEVVPLTSNHQLGMKPQASGGCQPLFTSQASSNSEAVLVLFEINLPSLAFRESPMMNTSCKENEFEIGRYYFSGLAQRGTRVVLCIPFLSYKPSGDRAG